ncbi:MAG: FKBP-type peptidyl-prolyl cis-trans isomerase [bacterium]|nr:FKBP-type peptidyl-prolyl cis-trans isomerase [bacterium]
MNNIQIGIAVVLALVVVGVFFLFPSLLPFNRTASVDPGLAAPAAADTVGGMAAVTELQITDEVVGSGAVVVAGDQITVNYAGMLTDGTVFDASANHGGSATFSIGVGQVIPGWDQGLIGMKEGGKRLLIIPAALAYGDAGRGDIIPPGATLIFEIELVKVTKP